jgi:predicted patatin/cPLA2 family phospholipase
MAKQNNLSPDVKLLEQAQKLAKAFGVEYDKIVDIQTEIINGQIRNTQELERALRTAREITLQERAKQKEADKQLKTKEKIAKLEEEILDIAHSLQKPISKIGKMTKAMNKIYHVSLLLDV